MRLFSKPQKRLCELEGRVLRLEQEAYARKHIEVDVEFPIEGSWFLGSQSHLLAKKDAFGQIWLCDGKRSIGWWTAHESLALSDLLPSWQKFVEARRVMNRREEINLALQNMEAKHDTAAPLGSTPRSSTGWNKV